MPMLKRRTLIMMMIVCLFQASGKAWAYRLGEVEGKLSAGASEVYDDNITYTKSNKVHDFITRPWVGISAAYNGKTTTFSASGRYYHELYADNSNFDNNGGDFTATVNSELSKSDRINISDTFSRAYEPRSFEDVFGYTGGRYSSTRNRVNLGYARDISQHIGMSLRYSNEYNTYSRSDIAKSYLNTAGVEGAYIVSSDLSFIGAYDFTRRDFDPGSAATTNTLSGGVRKFFTKQVYFDGIAGADFIDSYSGRNYIKPMAAVSLTDDINDRTNAKLSFSKRFDTVSYSQDLFDQWRVSAGLSHELTQKLRGSLNAFYGRGKYIGTGVANKLIGSTVGLTYDITDNWRADASYSFLREDSSAALGGYKKNTVTLGLTAEF